MEQSAGVTNEGDGYDGPQPALFGLARPSNFVSKFSQCNFDEIFYCGA
jgi:hypothetical protein